MSLLIKNYYIMKKLLLVIAVLFSVLNLFSCKENDKTMDNGFSEESDTTYVVNSTKVESIRRTFYFEGDRKDKFISLDQTLGSEDYGLCFYDGKNISCTVLDDKELDFFFKSCQIIFKNKNKNLNYEIGPLKMLHLSLSGDSEISLMGENLSGEYSYYYISKDDIINMENALIKYKAEK